MKQGIRNFDIVNGEKEVRIKDNDLYVKVVGRSSPIKVISSARENANILKSDDEMDKRATQAVKSAVEKAKFCKKPIARYDVDSKKVYVEYSNGERKYVD